MKTERPTGAKKGTSWRMRGKRSNRSKVVKDARRPMDANFKKNLKVTKNNNKIKHYKYFIYTHAYTDDYVQQNSFEPESCQRESQCSRRSYGDFPRFSKAPNLW